MNNVEEQENELVALGSIYEETFIKGTGDPQRGGGTLTIHLELPNKIKISLKTDPVKGHHVCHLPPIYLSFTYSEGYPSTTSPHYQLACSWLHTDQIATLCQQLDQIWIENKGSVVIFHWEQYLKYNSLNDLGITDHIELSVEKTADNLDKKESSENETSALDLLKKIIEYDEDLRRKEFETSSFECKVCYADKRGTKCLQFWPCDHVYCKDCIKEYFLVQIKEGNIKALKCPEHKCESEANPKQVQDLIPQDVYEKWDTQLLESVIYSGDVETCPRQHCGYPCVVDKDRGECPNCSYVFCVLCRMSYHGLQTCRLTSRALGVVAGDDQEIDGEPTVVSEKLIKMRRYQYRMSEMYVETYAKKCPNCSVLIDKDGGCPHMVCSRCNKSFFWDQVR